jgi:hypothetical protein
MKKREFRLPFFILDIYQYNIIIMKTILKKTTNTLAWCFLYLTCLIVFTGISVQSYFVYLQMTGKTEISEKYVKEFEITFDGRYKNNPKNIWYKN